MADLSVFGRLKSKQDYDRAEQEFQLRKQIAQSELVRSNRVQSPAAVQLANEIQNARASGDMQRLNDLVAAAKIYDRGVVPGADGSLTALEGYGDALGSIAGTKKSYETQAQKNIESVMNPRIVGAESAARQAQELRYAPAIESSRKIAEIEAENTAQAQAGLGQVESQAIEATDLIKSIKEAPGFSAVIGKPNPLKGQIPYFGAIPGTQAADVQAKIDQLKGKNFLQAFQSLKGGGAITEREGAAAENAIARMNQAQSEGEFKKSLDDLQNVINTGLDRMRAKAVRAPRTFGAENPVYDVEPVDLDAPIQRQSRMPPAAGMTPPERKTKIDTAKIPMAAIQDLRSAVASGDESAMQEFDQVFGAGSAKKVIK